MEGKVESQKSKKSVSTIILYTAAAVIALSGLAIIVSNLWMYFSMVSQYVAQGYPKAEVVKQLLPSQLMPGILQPLALYGGIALLLFYCSKIYEKVSKSLALLDPDETDTAVDDSPITNSIDDESTDVSESGEAPESNQMD